MWDLSWDLWLHRNKAQEARELRERETTVDTAIRQEYGTGIAGLGRGDQCLFLKTLPQRLLEPLQSKEAWLRRIEAARKRALSATSQREEAAFLSCLTSFFLSLFFGFFACWRSGFGGLAVGYAAE